MVDDEDQILTDAEYRDGLRLLEISQSKGWIVLCAIASDFIEEQKDVTFRQTENHLLANISRGKGFGVEEFMITINDRIKQALARQRDEANSAATKEQS